MSSPVKSNSIISPTTPEQWLDFLESQEAELSVLLQETAAALQINDQALQEAQEASDSYAEGCNALADRIELLNEKTTRHEAAYKQLLSIIGSAITILSNLAMKK